MNTYILKHRRGKKYEIKADRWVWDKGQIEFFLNISKLGKPYQRSVAIFLDDGLWLGVFNKNHVKGI